MGHYQKGIATLVTLIALVVMLLAAVALIRSTATSQTASGNIAFRRDLSNQAEAALQQVNSLFIQTGGALYSTTSRYTTNKTLNYSAVTLASSIYPGIPQALVVSDATFNSSYGASGNDIKTNGVQIRYVIDRMCSNAPSWNTLAPALGECVFTVPPSDTGGGANDQKAPGPSLLVYRITVRVTGPRNTMEFLQATYAGY